MSYVYPLIGKPINRYKPMFESLNIHIDLETHGVDYTQPTVVTSIGAACYIDGDLKTFTRNISVEESESLGFNSEPKTLEWIKTLSEDVQNSMYEKAVSPIVAITELNEFITEIAEVAVSRKMGLGLWGNSPKFDMQMLSHYYTKLGVANPFCDFLERDYRTLMSTSLLSRDQYSRIKEALVMELGSMQHCALWDAILQATTMEAISHISKSIRLGDHVGTREGV